MCLKSDFKEIFLKLVTNDRGDKSFLLTSKFCPLGLSVPDLRLYTFIKSWKDVYKVRGCRDCFGNLQQMTKVMRHSCWHQNFGLNGLSTPAQVLCTCIKSWKMCIKSEGWAIFLNMQPVIKVIRPFCFHKINVRKFVQWKAFKPPVVYTTDRSNVVVQVLFLFCVAL